MPRPSILFLPTASSQSRIVSAFYFHGIMSRLWNKNPMIELEYVGKNLEKNKFSPFTN
jgi:hypothetical protein